MRTAAEPFLSLDAQVTVEGIAEDTALALRQLWGYGVDSTPTRSIVVRAGPVPPVPLSQPVSVLVARTPLSVHVRGGELWLGEGLHLSVQEPGVLLTVGTAPVTGEAWLLALTEAHRVGGWLPLHAAVLMRGEQGVGITGASGAGKSTAALRLAGLGLTVLSEDHTWLRPSDRRVVGLDAHLRAFDDSVQTFAPHLLGRAAGRDVHGKLLLALTQPGGQATLQSLLVFGLSQSSSGGERVRAIWDAVGLPLTQTGRQATAKGISTLMAQLEVQGVTREGVVTEVRERLGRHTGPQSG